jgi:protein-S-isoprenylcysteine O-methyltransferase Ste14
VPGVLAPPPVLYAFGLALGLGLDALLPSPELPAAVRWALGGAVLAAGLALSASFILAFRRAGTAVDPGKPASALVTSGPYRLSRNPGYLALTIIYVGIVLLADAPWALALLPPTVVLVQETVIKREERYLERKFGEPYLRYRLQTRRWV